jgi:short subunit dehydrogenase-like uncharacterized protein
MPSDPVLLYGATGYTGRLIVEAALGRGLRPILAGRDEARVETMAATYGLEHRTASLDDRAGLDRCVGNVAVVVLAAGPFSATAVPMARCCLRNGIHYLDVSGECAAIEALVSHGAEARRRSCMVMPGCGFDVVASDCLVSHVSRHLPDARHLAIGLSGLVTPTRGSLRTIVEHAGLPVRTRRNGAFASVPPAMLRRRFDYGRGDGWSSAVTWGDVATAYHTTGIPNIEVYFEDTATFRAMLVTGRTFGPLLQLPFAQSWLKAHAQLFPEGPTATERTVHSCVIVAEAESPTGRWTSRLRTPEAYSLSARTAVAIAGRVLRGDVEFGFQTPARVYGPDFILQFDGVTREDMVSNDGEKAD